MSKDKENKEIKEVVTPEVISDRAEKNGHVEEDEIEVLKTRRPDVWKIIEHNNVRKKYRIVEMDGESLAAWMKFFAGRVQMNRRGVPTRQKYEGLHAELIHLCLLDEEGNRVPKKMIERWGSHILNKLFSICQEQNGLDDRVEEAEGKD